MLANNGKVFYSVAFKGLMNKWGVQVIYRCAYRPSGNGIVERCHCTIKRIDARSKCSIFEAVFWYNLLPKNVSDFRSSPSSMFFCQNWRFPGSSNEDNQDTENKYFVGQRVYVKPSQHVKCDETGPLGNVTNTGRGTSVEVAGVKRHIADDRIAYDVDDNENDFENYRRDFLLFSFCLNT